VNVLAGLESFIQAVADLLSVSSLWVSFVVGGVLVSVVVGIVGRIAFLMRTWGGQAGAMDRPQMAFTTKTPRQVVDESREARWKLRGCRTLILVVLAIAALIILHQLGVL
jgi:hypothetical protein